MVDLGTAACESLVSSFVWWVRRLRGRGHCQWWRSHNSQHYGPHHLDDDIHHPFWLSIDFDRVPNLDHLHRRRHQSQRHPLRDRDFEQRRHLVSSKSALERSRSDRHLVLERRGLRRGGEQREHGSGLDDHGDDDRRAVLGLPHSSSWHRSPERRLVPEHRRLLRRRSELGPRLCQRGLRMESRRHPRWSQRPQRNLVPDNVRLHSGWLRHLWEPRRHRYD